jgi:hypothetical protein
MNFVRKGEYLLVTRETGNKWNYLMVRLDDGYVGRPNCMRLERPDSWSKRQLAESEVVDAVLAGVSEANERCGTRYRVSHIRYVANDSPPESIYTYLASSLVERFHNGGEFSIGSPPET